MGITRSLPHELLGKSALAAGSWTGEEQWWHADGSLLHRISSLQDNVPSIDNQSLQGDAWKVDLKLPIAWAHQPPCFEHTVAILLPFKVEPNLQPPPSKPGEPLSGSTIGDPSAECRLGVTVCKGNRRAWKSDLVRLIIRSISEASR